MCLIWQRYALAIGMRYYFFFRHYAYGGRRDIILMLMLLMMLFEALSHIHLVEYWCLELAMLHNTLSRRVGQFFFEPFLCRRCRHPRQVSRLMLIEPMPHHTLPGLLSLLPPLHMHAFSTLRSVYAMLLCYDIMLLFTMPRCYGVFMLMPLMPPRRVQGAICYHAADTR